MGTTAQKSPAITNIKSIIKYLKQILLLARSHLGNYEKYDQMPDQNSNFFERLINLYGLFELKRRNFC